MTGREPNPNSDQEGQAEKRTSPSLFSASRSVCRRARQSAPIGAPIDPRHPDETSGGLRRDQRRDRRHWYDYRHFKSRKAHFFGAALGNGELVARASFALPANPAIAAQQRPRRSLRSQTHTQARFAFLNPAVVGPSNLRKARPWGHTKNREGRKVEEGQGARAREVPRGRHAELECGLICARFPDTKRFL